jgi:micrococcal nuclease
VARAIAAALAAACVLAGAAGASGDVRAASGVGRAATGAAGGSAGPVAAAAQTATVRRIVDGDTLDVRIGGSNVRVRLLQIDTPEVHSGAECWGRQASAALARLVPPGTKVTLYADPALDRTDRYGRALRYVFRGTTNVNVRLVAQGDAAPYFYDGERGRYAAGLERVALGARRAGLGLWGGCPGTVYDPYRAIDTGPPRG